MAIDTAEKRRAIGGVGLWLLPEVTPNVTHDLEWRGEAAYGYAFFAPAPPVGPGTDRRTRPTRIPPWKSLDVVLVERKPFLQTIIDRQRAAVDMRLEQQRLADDEKRIRDEAIAAALQRVEDEKQEYLGRLERKKTSVANLALARLAREKKRKAEEEKHERRRQTAIANLKKARKKK